MRMKVDRVWNTVIDQFQDALRVELEPRKFGEAAVAAIDVTAEGPLTRSLALQSCVSCQESPVRIVVAGGVGAAAAGEREAASANHGAGAEDTCGSGQEIASIESIRH
jgi:hypothetical protein